jgi:hypothetical protein
MTYVVTLPNLSTINIQDGSIDNTSTSLTLVGKNVPNWGQYYSQNLVELLTNFEGTASPANPLNGQTWWDSGNGSLKVFNGTVFKNITNLQSATVAPNNNVQGDMWWNNSLKTLNVFDSGLWTQVGGYILPNATQTVLGGIKVGSTMWITSDGTLNMMPATASTLGGIKPGTGLSIDSNGILAVIPTASATYTTRGVVQVGDGLAVDVNGLISNTYSYTLPQASQTVLGGIRLGTGFTVNGTTTSVDFSALLAQIAGLQSQVSGLMNELGIINGTVGAEGNFLVPTGMIAMWSGTVNQVPAGWALCDGSVQTLVNGGSITTPDLRSKFVVGAGNVYSVGQTGGTDSHDHTVWTGGTALSPDQMPTHSHSVNDPSHGHGISDPGHVHSLDPLIMRWGGNIWVAGNSGTRAESIYTAGISGTGSSGTGIGIYAAYTGISINNAGSGNAHAHDAACNTVNHLPPYYALAYIIKL